MKEEDKAALRQLRETTQIRGLVSADDTELTRLRNILIQNITLAP